MNNGGAAASTTTGTISMVASNINVTGSDVGAISASSATVGVAVISASSSTLVTHTSNAANVMNANSSFDAIDVMVEYANGPLLVRASHQVVDKGVYDVSGAKDQTTTALAASYKMDNITLVGTYNDVENGGGTDAYDVDGYFVGAKIAAGANTFGLGYLNEDDQDAAGKNKAWMLSVDHALSKRTSITAAYKDSDDDGTEVQQTAIGIKHVF